MKKLFFFPLPEKKKKLGNQMNEWKMNFSGKKKTQKKNTHTNLHRYWEEKKTATRPKTEVRLVCLVFLVFGFA